MLTELPEYEHIKITHEKFLYPVTRVVAVTSGKGAMGSGTCVYSQPDVKGSTRYESYILTNAHVIAGLINIEEKWNSNAGRNLKVETRAEGAVEFYQRENLSRVTGEVSRRAEVVAWDEQRDLALMKLRSILPVEYVAPIITPQDFEERVFITSPVYAVGCGMGIQPVLTGGHITGFDFQIDNFPYTLSSAPTIFGNSGGALMLQETGELIGVPARISVVFIGFGGSPIPHLSWAIHPKSIFEFLHEQKYDFIIDPTVDPRQREKEREELKRKSFEAQLTGPGTGEAEARRAAEIDVLEAH